MDSPIDLNARWNVYDFETAASSLAAGANFETITMDKLRVRFGEVTHGWIHIDVGFGPQAISFGGSYVYPSLLQLAETLNRLILHPSGEWTVVWTAEPVEFECRFRREAPDVIELRIEEFPDHRRSEGTGTTWMTAAGDYSQICLPFWRELRGLQGRYAGSELQTHWNGAALSDEIEKLTALLREHQIIT